jgi:hypothetical protein
MAFVAALIPPMALIAVVRPRTATPATAAAAPTCLIGSGSLLVCSSIPVAALVSAMVVGSSDCPN